MCAAITGHQQLPPSSQYQPTSILITQEEANPTERRYCTKEEIFNHDVYINSEDFSNSPSFLKMSYENTPAVPDLKSGQHHKNDLATQQRKYIIEQIRQLSQQSNSELQRTQKKPNYETPPSQSQRKKDNKQNGHSSTRNRATYRNINFNNIGMRLNMNVDWSLYDMDNLINIVDNMYEKAIDKKIQCNVNIELRANSKDNHAKAPFLVQPPSIANATNQPEGRKGVTIEIQKLKLMQKCRQKMKQFNMQQSDQLIRKKTQKLYQIIAQQNDEQRCLSATQRVSIELLPQSNQNQHKCKQQQQEQYMPVHHLQSQSQSQIISSARQHNTSYKESSMEPIQIDSQNSEQSQRHIYRMQPIREMGSQRRNKNSQLKDMQFGSLEWRKPVLISYKVTKCNNDDHSRVSSRNSSNYGIIKKQEQLKQPKDNHINKLQFQGTPIMKLPDQNSQQSAHITTYVSTHAQVDNVLGNIDTNNFKIVTNTNTGNQIKESKSNGNNKNSSNFNSNYNSFPVSSNVEATNSHYNSNYKGVYQQILSEYTTAKLLAISKQRYNNKTNKPNPKPQQKQPAKTSRTIQNTSRSAIKSKSQDKPNNSQRQNNNYYISQSVEKDNGNKNKMGLCFVNNQMELCQIGRTRRQ